MKHYYKVEDQLEIKLMVLYTLRHAGKPLSDTELTDIICESADLNYIELIDCLYFLVNAGEIHHFEDTDGVRMFDINNEGQSTIGFFQKHIPYAVREYIEENTNSLFAMQKDKRQLICDISPIDFDNFTADIKLSDNDFPLLDMKIYSGNRENAKSICELYKRNAENIYQDILQLIVNYSKDQR